MRSSSTIFCHWSIERMRCSGFCTIAASATSPRSGRAASGGGKSTMCGCEESTRLTMLACCPASAADMKMITPTPIDTPTMMETVCSRPSRRKRLAAIHSNGSQSRMRHRAHAARPAASARPPAPPRRRARGPSGSRPSRCRAGRAPPCGGQRAPVLHHEDPGRGAGRVAHRVGGQRDRVRAARHFDVDRDGHVLAQVRRRLAHAELHFHRAALRVDARD